MINKIKGLNMNKIMMNNFDKMIYSLIEYTNVKLIGKNSQYKYENNKIILRTQTGENVGGNSWGKQSEFVAIEPVKLEFDLLEHLCIGIDANFTLKNYKKIMELVSENESYINDFYQNGRYYNELMIKKDDLVNAFKEMNIKIDSKTTKKLDAQLIQLYLENPRPEYKTKEIDQVNNSVKLKKTI